MLSLSPRRCRWLRAPWVWGTCRAPRCSSSPGPRRSDWAHWRRGNPWLDPGRPWWRWWSSWRCGQCSGRSGRPHHEGEGRHPPSPREQYPGQRAGEGVLITWLVLNFNIWLEILPCSSIIGVVPWLQFLNYWPTRGCHPCIYESPYLVILNSMKILIFFTAQEQK